MESFIVPSVGEEEAQVNVARTTDTTQSASGRGRRRSIAAAAGLVVAAGLLSGCWSGFNAATDVQQPSGDGTYVAAGTMLVNNAIWVQDPSDPTQFTLSAAFVNQSTQADTLEAVQVEPAGTVSIPGGSLVIEPQNAGFGTETRVGYNSNVRINASGIADLPETGYINTTFRFATAGAASTIVMSVPAVGIYADVYPGGTPTPTPEPVVTTTPSE